MAMDPEGPVIVDDDGDHDDSDAKIELSCPYQSSGYCQFGPQSFGSPNFQPHGLPPPSPPHSMYYTLASTLHNIQVIRLLAMK